MSCHKHDVEHELEHVIAELKQHNIRMTPQRRAILAYMITSHQHPTVEEIYRDLLPEWPSLSLATVYNNLAFLVKAGYVTEMKFSDIVSRYDYMGYRHYHVICQRCGKIADFSLPQLTDVSQYVLEQTGYTVNKTRFEVYGICPNCQQLP